MSLISLYPAQREAVRRMHNGCILCGDVGSGKSITAIAYYYTLNGGNLDKGKYVKMADEPADLYIITTARKRDTFEWESELAHFLISKKDSIYKHKVVIDSWNNIKKYTNVDGAFFIFDEQRVVGKGQWVTSFLKIVKNNSWVLLSATPGDTWSDYIPVFIANGFYRHRSDFNNQHIVWKPFMNFPVVDHYINTGKLIRHRAEILVNMDVLRGTTRHNIDIPVSYDIQQYKNTCVTRWDIFDDTPIQNASQFCQCLRRIVNSDPSRINQLLELTKKHDRIIVFYNYNYELKILRDAKWDNDIQKAEWNGGKHEPIPDSKRWVYFVQYTAGCEGWNCISTDTIVFYSENYSYKIMYQASGRIDRVNTPFYDLYYYHFKSQSSIDRRIGIALKQKKKFNEKAFSDNLKLERRDVNGTREQKTGIQYQSNSDIRQSATR